MPSDDRPPEDLVIPFIFMPRGDPEPTEWMAQHPGWIKILATFVPRASAGDGLADDAGSVIRIAAIGDVPFAPPELAPDEPPGLRIPRPDLMGPMLFPTLLAEILRLYGGGKTADSASRAAPAGADTASHAAGEKLTPPIFPLRRTPAPPPPPPRAAPRTGGWRAHRASAAAAHSRGPGHADAAPYYCGPGTLDPRADEVRVETIPRYDS